MKYNKICRQSRSCLFVLCINRALFFGFCFLILSSCKQGLRSTLESEIEVRLLTYSRGNVVRSHGRPIIHYSGGNQICRPYPFRNSEARRYLSESTHIKLNKTALDYLFGEESEQQEQPNQELKPVVKSVGNGWLKFGLYIGNGNKGEGKNVYLIIQTLEYRAKASYRGRTIQHQGTVSSADCDGPPFLYIVPPDTEVNYDSFSRHPLENLTIFLSGFPAINPDDPTRLRMPNYSVELTLLGRFIIPTNNESEAFEMVTDFSKTIKFRTRSIL